ncbi:Smad nuclear-interacting protein 1 like [Verticillium longisporum]
MGSDEGSRERPARSSRHRDEGDDRPRKSDRDAHRRRSRDRDSDRRRDRSRSREPRRKERRRSHTPDASRRHRDRHRDDDSARRRDRDADRGDRHRRRRSPGDAAASKTKSEFDRHTKRRSEPSPSPEPLRRQGPLPSQTDSFAVTTGEEAPTPKEQPNFGNSGALAAASNSVQQADGTSIVLKYHEPPEARKPPAKDDWKLFVFKGQDVLDTIGLGARSCWLVGREMAVVDLAAEHPSVSKQHAAIQFRFVEKRNEFGDRIGKVKPYLIDLESANGTELNGKKVAESRYVELRHKDMVKFGHSTREYVIMLAPK